MRAERDNCCDDLAVAATGDARQYAAALTALEQNRWAAHELALAATGGSLVKRIRRLLQQPERPSAAWTPIFSAGVLAVSAGIALAGWQAQPPQKAQPRVPAVLPAPPAAPVAVELPAAPVRKRAPQLLAQAQQSVEEQLKSQLQREGTANQQPTPYKKWLNEDVAYIITDQERAAYKALATDEEREQFITQFWQIRDPTPGTAENEFKDEHYRRIAYANMAFSSSVPGWKTDRGRIYITYGPPDELEDHSAGGATSTVPFQRWRYRFIEGTGTNVIIEFVDSDKTGEFRMTTGTRIFQFQSAGNPPASANIFTSVGDGPKVTLSVTSAKVNTQVSLALPSGSGKTDIIARITGANNQTVANLRDFTVAGQLNYKSGFRITPGSYTLTLVTRDQTSGAMQTSTVNFYVN
jgi:GWxTD domain-containing protein